MAWEEYRDFSSSNISQMRYDSETLTMEIAFSSGGVYQYYDVPDHVWAGMKAAPSKGTYLHQAVKGHFRYSRV